MKRTSAVLAACFLAFFVTLSAFANTFSVSGPLLDDDEHTVVAFDVYSDPDRTDYIVGETVDLTGFSARMLTSAGFVQQNLEGKENASFEENYFISKNNVKVTVTPKVLLDEGKTDVIITAGEAKYIFTVNVEADPDMPCGLDVISLPKKLEYTVGDTIDLTGFSATIVTGNGYATDKLKGSGSTFAKNSYLEYYKITPTVTPVKFDKAGSIKVVITVGSVQESFTVKVNEAENEDDDKLVGMTIDSKPKKLEYTVGDTIDLTGFSATLVTGNGYATDKLKGSGSTFAKNSYLEYYKITPTVSPAKFDKAGSIKVVITVGSVQEGFTVKVNEAENEDNDKLVGMTIDSKPSKLEYTVGDTIDLTGFSATLVTGNGYASDKLKGSGSTFAKNTYLEYQKITPTVTPVKFDKAGSIKVVITVGDIQDSFTVTVKEKATPKKKVVSLEIASEPFRYSYKPGEKIDLDGLEIKMLTEDGYVTEKLVGEDGFFKHNLFTDSENLPVKVEYDFSTPGKTKVMVKVGDASCEFDVTVDETAEGSSEEASEEPSEEPSEEASEEAKEESKEESKEETSEEESEEKSEEVSEETSGEVSEEISETAGTSAETDGDTSENAEGSESADEDPSKRNEESASSKSESEINRETEKEADKGPNKYVVYGGIFVGGAAIASLATLLVMKRKKK